MKTIIYANCQVDGLALFLPRLGYPGEITVYRNFQFILGTADPADMFKDAKSADLFIYQKTDACHGAVSSDAVLELLSQDAETLSFCPGYNHGFFPLLPGKRWDMPFWSWKRRDVLDAYDAGMLDFHFQSRFLECLANQAAREETCNIKMTDWILLHRNKLPFLTVNHPDSLYFFTLSKRIMSYLCLSIEGAKEPLRGGRNAAKLPCMLPVHSAVIEHFGSHRDPNPKAKQFFRDLLIKHYNANHHERNT